jgi:hypothetical protein
MTRGFILLLAIAGAAGCRMCASPYDYCGPVVDDCCCASQYNAAPCCETGCCDTGYEGGPEYYEDAPAIQESPTMTMPMTSSKSSPARSKTTSSYRSRTR